MQKPAPAPFEPALPTTAQRLPNGLVVVAVPRPAAATAYLALDVLVGSRHESVADGGLTHFLEHMVFQGCPSQPDADAVNAAAESMGSVFDACTGREVTRLEHHMDPAHLADSARLLAELAAEPRFNDIESERAIILEEALDEFDEHGKLVDGETLSRLGLWPDHPLGRSIIGPRDNIKRFGLEDLRRHHQRYYGAANMVLTVVGPQDEASLRAAVAPFGRLPTGVRSAPPPVGEAPKGPLVELVEDGRSQCECRLAVRTPGREAPGAAALAVLRHALDDGLSSRLHRRLGGELGLAYDLWASWERYTDTGVFEIGANVSPAKVEQFIEEAQGLLVGLAERPPTGEELDRVRFRARWALRMHADAAEGLADLYGLPWLYQNDPPSPASWLAAVEKVDPPALAAAAQTLLNAEQRMICVVGPLDKGVRRTLRRRAVRQTF